MSRSLDQRLQNWSRAVRAGLLCPEATGLREARVWLLLLLLIDQALSEPPGVPFDEKGNAVRHVVGVAGPVAPSVGQTTGLLTHRATGSRESPRRRPSNELPAEGLANVSLLPIETIGSGAPRFIDGECDVTCRVA